MPARGEGMRRYAGLNKLCQICKSNLSNPRGVGICLCGLEAMRLASRTRLLPPFRGKCPKDVGGLVGSLAVVIGLKLFTLAKTVCLGKYPSP